MKIYEFGCLEYLARDLCRQLRPGRSIVGIAGAPGAGKSTLAQKLVAYLTDVLDIHSAYLPMDGFHFSNAVLRPIRARYTSRLRLLSKSSQTLRLLSLKGIIWPQITAVGNMLRKCWTSCGIWILILLYLKIGLLKGKWLGDGLENLRLNG